MLENTLAGIRYEPEENSYIYEFRMSEQQKQEMENKLRSYGDTLQESIPKYLQSVIDGCC